MQTWPALWFSGGTSFLIGPKKIKRYLYLHIDEINPLTLGARYLSARLD